MVKKIADRSLDEFLTTYSELLNRGLSCGISDSKGRVCIEAAVCLAMGEREDLKDIKPSTLRETDLDDQPNCVDPEIASFKIEINDSYPGKSAKARAEALKELGIAQLGTRELKGVRKFGRMMREKLNERYGPERQAAFLKKHKIKTLDDLLVLEPSDASVIIEEYHEAGEVVPEWGEFSNYYGMGSETQQRKRIREVIDIALEVLRELKSPGIAWLDAIKGDPKLRKKLGITAPTKGGRR